MGEHSFSALEPPLSGTQLTRVSSRRTGAEGGAAAWLDPATRTIAVSSLGILVERGPTGEVSLAYLAQTGELPAPSDQSMHIDLGDILGPDGRSAPRFAHCIFEESLADHVQRETSPLASDGTLEWLEARRATLELREAQRAMVVAALSLFNWHRQVRRDGGAPAAAPPAFGGWGRLDDDGREHFPRMDPAVIVLVTHGDLLLLGSNVLWEEGRYSLLAGYVEAGESIEQTVHREIFEEAGVRVSNPRYLGSQPWPFPRSLMLGFHAQLDPAFAPGDERPDVTEIADLRWFSRDELRTPPPGVLLPEGISIARWLLDWWLAGDA